MYALRERYQAYLKHPLLCIGNSYGGKVHLLRANTFVVEPSGLQLHLLHRIIRRYVLPARIIHTALLYHEPYPAAEEGIVFVGGWLQSAPFDRFHPHRSNIVSLMQDVSPLRTS